MKKSIILVIFLAGLISAKIYGLDNPDSLYSVGLTRANPHTDPYGQMRNFLGITWNFLPENTKIQKEVKPKYAQIYKRKFGELPTHIDYSIPASANIEKLCVQVKEKCSKNIRKAQQQSKLLENKITKQEKTIKQLRNHITTLQETGTSNPALEEIRAQCSQDINKIQQGYGTIVAYRNAFKEKELEFNNKVQSFLKLRYGSSQCIDINSQCEEEKKSLKKAAEDLKQFIPLIEVSATNLRNALNQTIGIDLEVPIKTIQLGTMYTLKNIQDEIELL